MTQIIVVSLRASLVGLIYQSPLRGII